jgi:hypothetical protein
MPGTRAGTGQPITFRCWQCRRQNGTAEVFGQLGTLHLGRINRVKLTGRKLLADDGCAGIRTSRFKRQYTCMDCDHTGWSRHTDLSDIVEKL